MPLKKTSRRAPDGRMPLQAHLIELKNRSIVAAIAVLFTSIIGWFLYDPVLAALMKPLTDLAADSDKLVTPAFNTVTSPFDFKVRISFYIGLVLASPVWIYQILAFVSPGLTKSERKYIFGFLFVGFPLFILGGYSGFLFIPQFVNFMIGFTPEGVANIPGVQIYLQMVTQVMLAMGISFLVPVVLVAMNFMGVIRGRTMLQGWRWMVVASFTFSAIVTPTPEVTMMFFVAAPMLVLFTIAIVIGFLHDRVADRKHAAELATLTEGTDGTSPTNP